MTKNPRAPRTFMMTLGLLLASAILAPRPAQAHDGPTGLWEGSLDYKGQRVEIQLRFIRSPRGLEARLDIPKQKLKGVILGNVQWRDPVIRFEWTRSDGRMAFEGEMKQGAIKGVVTLAQSTGEFAVWPAHDRNKSKLVDLVSEFGKFPGQVSLTIRRLGKSPKEAATIASVHSETSVAIASSFKLYVLGALIDDLRAGKRKLSDTVLLKKQWRSMSSGMIHKWPENTPMTLNSLAALMISISDNTAADHLLMTLGRGRVEAQLKKMGHKHSAKCLPLLATRESFILKNNEDLAQKYLKAKLKGKRALLKTLPAIDPDGFKLHREPRHVKDIQWFASSSDLCRALDWILKATEKGRAKPLRRVMSITQGLPVRSDLWSFAGFKSGSEPGVLCANYLLKRKDGPWVALSMLWNTPKNNLSIQKFVQLLRKILEALGRET